MIQVIHISDTHLGPSNDFVVRTARTRERLDQLLVAVRARDLAPDLMIHTGDITNDPHPDAYRIAAEIFGELPWPVYFATGNHDDAGMIRAQLPMAPLTPLVDDPDRHCYRIDLPEHRVYVLDGKVPEEEGPHGELPENQLRTLEKELAASNLPFSVFLHFPPFPIGSPWIDDYLLLRNGKELHRILVKIGVTRNRGVFFGHLHRGLQIYRDGILYSGISSPACQFRAGLEADCAPFEPDCPLPFNHITFFPDATAVKEYTVLR